MVIGIENDYHGEPIWPGVLYSVQLAQYTILAKQNHPAFAELVQRVCHNLADLLNSKRLGDDTRFDEVMSSTGSFVFTEVMIYYFGNITGTHYDGSEFVALAEPLVVGDCLLLPKRFFGSLG